VFGLVPATVGSGRCIGSLVPRLASIAIAAVLFVSAGAIVFACVWIGLPGHPSPRTRLRLGSGKKLFEGIE
jgi:hypothetical protein